MGVKLKSLIESDSIPLQNIQESMIAVDGMNMLFQILYNPIQRRKKLANVFYLDSTQRVITHLYGWIQKINHFFKNKILPVVVFDGKPNTFKRMVTKDYAHDFLVVEKMYQECIAKKDIRNAKNHALSKTYMFMNCVHESKQLLEACGIPVIMAPSEAEAQCVALQQQGVVDYVVSNDYDVLLFGATKIIRKMTFQTRSKVKGQWRSITPNLDVIDNQANLDRLGITRNNLIDISLLLGNDYFKGVSGIGPKKAMAAIAYYGTIQKMIRAHPERFPHLPLWKAEKIQKLFTHHETVTISPHSVGLKPFNMFGLRDLLLEDHTLHSEKIVPKIEKLQKQHRKLAQFFKIDPSKLSYSSSELKPFNIHIQRRLARAKTKIVANFTPSLCFVTGDQVQDPVKKIKKQKSHTSGNSHYIPKKLKLKKNIREKEDH
jgi:flap endonuclease-1